MVDIINLNECPRANRHYGGNAGRKTCIMYDDALWMVKFPESTRGMRGNLPSYTTSPIAEYLGSHLYEMVGLPAHQTLLGFLDGKVVVACRDLTYPGPRSLVSFHDVKNSAHTDEELPDGSASNGSSTYLSDILSFLYTSDAIADRLAVIERFYDMFVMDAFIGNVDRNNENWGFIQGDDPFAPLDLAPVYDNGNSFFNKRSVEKDVRSLNDPEQMRELALKTLTSVYKRDDGRHIHPFAYISKKADEACNEAISRLVPRISLDAIYALIDSLPESAYGSMVMPHEVGEFHKEILRLRYEEGLFPAL